MFGLNLGSIKAFLRLDTKDWDRKHRQITRDLSRLGREMLYLGAAATGSVTAVVREFGTFDRAIREATAVTSGLTQGEFREMRKMAEDMSIQLNKAATETARGFYYLGSAGLSATEQMQSYNTVISLARALTVDTAQAAEGLVDVMKAFNIEFSKSTHVGDTLVATITTSNQVFSDLEKALSYVSATASQMGNTLEETSAILGIMANAGIKGSMAGVAMRRAITNLASPTSEMRKLMANLGISTFTTTGEAKKFHVVFGEISEILENSTDEIRNMAFEVLFGRRAIAGMIKVFDEGTEGVKDYIHQIEDMRGEMDRVTRYQMEAFLHQLGKIWRRMQRLARTLGETLVPTIKEFGTWIDLKIVKIEDWVSVNKELTTTILKLTAGIGALMIPTGLFLIALPSIVTSIGLLAGAFVSLILPLAGAVAGFYALRASWGIAWEGMVDILNDFGKNFEDWVEDLGKVFKFGLGFMTDAFRWFANEIMAFLEKMILIYNRLRMGRIFTLGIFGDIWNIMKQQPTLYFKEGDFTGQIKKLGLTMREIASKDFAFFTGKIKEMFPWLSELYNIFAGGKARKGIPGFEAPSWMGKTIRIPGVTKEVTNAFMDQWRDAIANVMREFKTLQDGIQDMFKDTVSGWEQAIRKFMQLSGTFRSKFHDLIRDIYNAMYQAFVNFIAKTAAQTMFGALAKQEAVVQGFPLTMGGIYEAITGRKWALRHYYTPGLSVPGTGGGGMQINIQNNSGVPLMGREDLGNFAQKTAVRNIVLELAETDNTIRQTIVNR